jgi:uncharacterized protein YggE
MSERFGVSAMLSVAVAALVVGAGVAVAGVAVGRTGGASPGPQKIMLDSAQNNPASGATITVTGNGSVEGTPDTVSFQIGVHTVSSTATSALSQNNAQVASLESTLEHHGVATSDMQTSNLALSDNTNSSNVITGFSCDDDLNVTMHGIGGAGQAIDAAANAVGNGIQMYGISFAISNKSSLLATARARAMQNAWNEANQLALGAGDTLGSIVRVTDQENQVPQWTFATGAAYDAAAVPVDAGRQPVSVQVTVVYSLKP